MESAGNHDIGPGSIRRRIAEQIHHGPGQVIAVPNSLHGGSVLHDVHEVRLFGPQLARHVRFNVSRVVSASPRRPCVTYPGLIQLVRMPCGASSTDKAVLSVLTAPLLA